MASVPETEIREIQRHDSTLKIPIFNKTDKLSSSDSLLEGKEVSENTYSTVPCHPSTHNK